MGVSSVIAANVMSSLPRENTQGALTVEPVETLCRAEGKGDLYE